MDRRAALKIFGMSALALATKIVLPQPIFAGPLIRSSAHPDPEEITKRFIIDAKSKGLDFLGDRRTDAWPISDNQWAILYETGGQILNLSRPEVIRPWNLLDYLNEEGYDGVLKDGSLGVTIPKKQKLLLEQGLKQTPKPLQERYIGLKNLGFDPGSFTAPPKDYGTYWVVRTQALALQYWPLTDTLNMILSGSAAVNAKIPPKEVILNRPTNDPDVNPILGINCEKAGITHVGVGSYYSVSECLGCTGKMANGDPLRDDQLTIAYWRAPLDKSVLIEDALDLRKQVIAKVTDTGGFDLAYNPYPRLVTARTANRIFDATPAVISRMAPFVTDQSVWRITQIDGPGCIERYLNQ